MRCTYLGCTESSQNTPIGISRGLHVVSEISVPSTESVRRPLMFVLATIEEIFGFVAFVLENTDFFGNLPKSDCEKVIYSILKSLVLVHVVRKEKCLSCYGRK